MSLSCGIMLKPSCQDTDLTAYIGLLYLRRRVSIMTSILPSLHTRLSISYMTALILPPSLVYRSKRRHADRNDGSIVISMVKQVNMTNGKIKLNSSCNRLYSSRGLPCRKGAWISQGEKRTPPRPSSSAITDVPKGNPLTTINDAIRHCKLDIDRQCISPFGTPFSASAHRRLPI
jgi:hypothetical protein